MLFFRNFFKNNKIVFNSNTINRFENYIGFQYYPISTLTNLGFQLFKNVTKYFLTIKKI